MAIKPLASLFLTCGLAVSIGTGFLLASDDEHWPIYSLLLVIVAGVASYASRRWASLTLEGVAALVWLTALIVSVRWIVIPVVFFPLAALAVAGAPLVLLIERNRRRLRDREQMNLCVHCGYDLRASPDRCPECGAIIEGETARLRRIAEEMKRARIAKKQSVPDSQVITPDYSPVANASRRQTTSPPTPETPP